jgi:hypothetical protein
MPIAYKRLSVGEYYFYDLDEETAPTINDTREIDEVKWMTIDEMKNVSCNVDVNNFLIRLRRNIHFFREYV